MDPFIAFSNYQAIKLHFTNQRYDAVTFNYKSRTLSRESFEKRRDKSHFHVIAKRFRKEETIRDFFISNIVYKNRGDSFWIGDFLDEEADRTYARFVRVSEGFTYEFRSDIIRLRDRMLSLESRDPDLLINTVEEGTDFPPVINMMLYGNVHVESVLFMNRVMGFMNGINGRVTKRGENFIWVSLYNKLVKYDRLMKPLINTDKAKSIILETFRKEITI